MVSSALYLSRSARAEIRSAQSIIDWHVLAATGVCLGCGASGDCPEREAAARVFAQYRQLPKRRPGSSQPERIGLRRMAVGPR